MFCQPVFVDLLGLLAVIGAVEQDNAVAVWGALEQGKEIVLSATGFGEDQRLCRRAQCFQLRERTIQGGEQRLPLGVVADLLRQHLVAAQLGNLFADGFLVFIIEELTGKFRLPLFGIFIEGLVIPIQ